MNYDWPTLYGKEEWAFILRLGRSFTDKEQKEAFWEIVKSKKLADKNYSIYQDFPQGGWRQVCEDILATLRNKSMATEPVKNSPLKRSLFRRLLGELVFQGFHKPEHPANKKIEPNG